MIEVKKLGKDETKKEEMGPMEKTKTGAQKVFKVLGPYKKLHINRIYVKVNYVILRQFMAKFR